MEDIKAALKVARSLLKVRCAGLIFESGKIVLSGKIDQLEQTKFSDALQCNGISSFRYFDFKNTSTISPLLSCLPNLSCCLIEPLPQCNASLFFLDDSNHELDIALTEENISHLVHLFIELLKPLNSLLAEDVYKDMVGYNDLLRLNNKIPIYIALVDQDLRYEYINDAYAQRFSLSKKEVVGEYVKGSIPAEICAVTEENVVKGLSGVTVNFQYELRQGDEDELRFIDASYVPRIVHGEVTGLYLYMQDITSQQRTLNTLKRLHEVTANLDLSLDEKLQSILQVGVEQFSLPIGLISRIEGDDYYVEYSHTPGGEVLPGAKFDLGSTYCIHTLENDLPTSYFHTAISDIKEHPCYKAFGLEAYIGIVIYVGGKRWGTLNFSSPNPKTKPFGDDDYEVMKLLSQWVGNEITQHQDETNLKAAAKQQNLILEAVHEGIFGVDSVGNITFANSAACHILEYSVEELLGRNLIEALSHRDKDGHAFALENNPIQESLLSGENCRARGEYFCRKNGVVFVCEYTCVAMNSEMDLVEGVVVSFQDKTEQIQAENELLEQKSLFESLFINAPEAIILVGINRDIKMINPAFTELFGYQPSDVIGKSTQMLYAEEDDFIERGNAYSGASQDVLNRYRVSYKNSQGKVFHSETIGSMIQNADGSFGGYIGHIRDVSERLEVEQKMIDTNIRLSIATDTAGIGVWELDIKTDTLHWDDWMYQLYGFSKDDQYSPTKVWEECVHFEDREKLKHALIRLEDGGAYFKDENDEKRRSENLDSDFRITRKDGQTRYLKSNATIIFDRNGDAAHIIGVNMDVTSRKETEVVLQEASDQAVAASKAKSNFLATMSHEIRTPLNGVLGMAELLSGTQLDLEQRQSLNILRESGEGLLELINGILDFSKIEAGHLSIELEDFNLEKAIYDVARLLMLKAEEKGIDLLIEYQDDCPRFLVGDVFRVKQILTNLVSNAIKFTSTGHVLISTKGVVDQQGIVSVTMSVIDTGVGIAEEVQPYLFNAFVQADSSTTRRFGGTGLGLAITKQLIGLMNGEISLSSELNVGSTFTIALSLPESHAIPSIEKMADEFLLIGKKTLVIDDNDINLTILKNQLKSCDIYADTELDPLQGLARIERAINDGSPYHIVLLDYMMPELDGLMLSKLIREISGSMSQPIILMASSADFLPKESLSAAGVNVCISKPMSSSVLKKGLIDATSSNLLGHQVSYSELNEIQNTRYEERDSVSKRGLILVVEDMKANMAVACGILAKMGFDIVEAENGALGIDMWEVHKPDLIFMDLHMPVMDGLSAMRRIRQAEKNIQNKRVPILALTADIQQETLSKVFRAGGDGLIPKPFKQKEFISMLDKWLPGEQQGTDVSIVGNNTPAESAFEIRFDIVIEESVLNELKTLLGDDFLLLIEAFYGDADQIISSLEEMLVTCEAPDYKAISQLTHSLKSISLNVGAAALSSMAAQLEQESRQGKVLNLSAKLRELITMYHNVKIEIQRIVACL